METVDTSSRIAELRKLMKEREIDIYGKYLHLCLGLVILLANKYANCTIPF